MNLRRLTSILLSAVLISGAVPSSIKASASFPMPDISYSAKEAELSEIDIAPSFAKAASIQEAGSQVRDFMASKTPSFTVSIPRSSVSDPKTAHKYVLAEALKETSKANEGDYIRYGWKKYDCTYSISTSAVTMTFDMQYYTTYQEETAVTNECRRILSSLGTGDMSDYDKIKTIYRYIARNTSYADSISNQHVFTAYGALIDHVAVCQGYSQLFYRMMRESGIDCRIISGTSNNENHAWNIVKLGGIYYLMDVTWDSSLGNNSMIYFLRGSKDLDAVKPQYPHVPEQQYDIIFEDFNSAQFKAAYPTSEYKYVLSVGDVNGNGKTDAVDASAILIYYAETSAGKSGNFDANQKTAADVNKNKKTDAVDASLVLGYYAASSAGYTGTITEYITKTK